MENVSSPYQDLPPRSSAMRSRIFDLEAEGYSAKDAVSTLREELFFTGKMLSVERQLQAAVSAVRHTMLDSPETADAISAMSATHSVEATWFTILKHMTAESPERLLEVRDLAPMYASAVAANRHLSVKSQTAALQSASEFRLQGDFVLHNPSLELTWSIEGEDLRFENGDTLLYPILQSPAVTDSLVDALHNEEVMKSMARILWRNPYLTERVRIKLVRSFVFHGYENSNVVQRGLADLMLKTANGHFQAGLFTYLKGVRTNAEIQAVVNMFDRADILRKLYPEESLCDLSNTYLDALIASESEHMSLVELLDEASVAEVRQEVAA